MSSLTARALVFFTSAAVLVLEILAGRLLAPYVGVTLETFTAIIGTVLAGPDYLEGEAGGNFVLAASQTAHRCSATVSHRSTSSLVPGRAPDPLLCQTPERS